MPSNSHLAPGVHRIASMAGSLRSILSCESLEGSEEISMPSGEWKPEESTAIKQQLDEESYEERASCCVKRSCLYKYLGVHLNNKLDWTDNTAALYRKGQSRPRFLRRLRSFGAQGALLRTFFDAVVASAILYGVVCWGSSIFNADRKRLNTVIKKSSSVLGCPPDPVEVVGDRRMRTKFKHMLKNLSHPMYHSLEALGSSFSARLLYPPGVKERYHRSFPPPGRQTEASDGSAAVEASDGSAALKASVKSLALEASDGSTAQEASDETTAQEASDGSAAQEASDGSAALEASDGSAALEASDGSAALEASDRSAAMEASDGSTAQEASDETTAQEASDGSAALEASDGSAAMEASERSAAVEASERSAAVEASDRSAAVEASDRSAAVEASEGSAAIEAGEWSAAMEAGEWSAALEASDGSAALEASDGSAALEASDVSAALEASERECSNGSQ
ncbi:hypothetical protein NFI96_019878 [Prochilodus magdalenae]|nr:hypothetical protein NFI96_019878 [Prochilodus magdalenae]